MRCKVVSSTCKIQRRTKIKPTDPAQTARLTVNSPDIILSDDKKLLEKDSENTQRWAHESDQKSIKPIRLANQGITQEPLSLKSVV